MIIAQIGDTHLTGDGALLAGRIDTVAALARLPAGLRAPPTRPDPILFSGDLTKDATPQEYRMIGAACLDWLETALAARAGRPALIFQHHAPIVAGPRAMDSSGRPWRRSGAHGGLRAATDVVSHGDRLQRQPQELGDHTRRIEPNLPLR